MTITMLRSARNRPERRQAIDRVRAWTRERFDLGEDSAILVAEIACSVPGCPPLETVIAFWADGQRHHTKVFKPVAEVVEDDLPPGWMMPALAVPEGFGCDCC